MRVRHRLFAAAATAVALLAAGTGGQPQARPAPPGLLPAPGSPAWEPTTFRSIDRHTDYAGVDWGAEPGVRGESRCSASALVLSLGDAAVPGGARLRWRWAVDRGLEIADERVRAGDDFAARVYALFPFDASEASLGQRIRHAVQSRLYGRELPGQTLNYVWASRAGVGESWKSPYNDSTHVSVLRSGEADDWRTETVDLAVDFERLSGQAYRPPIAIGLMVDSDDTCGHAIARFAGFEILPPPGPEDAP